MKRAAVILLAVLLCGCNVRERLDIGSAKAIKELQNGHNDMLPVLQRLAETDSKLAQALVEKHGGDSIQEMRSRGHR